MELELLKSLSEYSSEKAKKEFDLGDTLDVKTGLILAALTFLAIQSGDFLKECGLPTAQVFMQVVSVLALVLGGGLCAWELWPRDYEREAQPLAYTEWIEKTEAYRVNHPEWEPVTPEKLFSNRLESAITSVAVNLKINKLKSSIMFWAFICSLVSFGANIITLVMRLF